MRHLLELFLFFIVLMGLPDWYIFRTYISQWKKKGIRILYWLPSILILIGMIDTFGSFEPKPPMMQRMGSFLILFLCVNVPKAVFCLLSIIIRSVIRNQKQRVYGAYTAGVIAIFILGYILYGATEGKQHFQVKEIAISSKDIPDGFHDYRIVQIADIHCGSWSGNAQALQKAVDIINEQHPDLIVFTGDLVNSLSSELDEFMPILSQLKAKDGVYSVLGNHDYSMYIPWENEADRLVDVDSLKAKQARMGWELLNNSHVKLHRNNDSIALIGVENSGKPPFPDLAKLSDASAGTDGMFRILLSHDPTHWRREVLPQTDIQLTLSGHTHAMQTEIFGFSPAMLVFPEYSGLYQEGSQMLYVNIGLGHLMYPMRLGAWPEITLLTLEKK